MRRLRLPLVVLAALLSVQAYAGDAPALSDAMKAHRPAGGEWMGLYLLGKKVGYTTTDLALDPKDPSRALSTNVFYFKANVGSQTSVRKHVEYRTYEAKPKGRLLSFRIEQSGDGGDQTMEGTATPQGVHVVIRRPGQASQEKNLPATVETIEDADQARVALLRHAKVEGTILDGVDLDMYKVTTTVEKPETRLVAGAKTQLGHVQTLSAKDKTPLHAYFTPDGTTVEIDLGQTLRAVAEPEAVAKTLDDVEVFTLSRVVLPRALPANIRDVPNSVTVVVTGLPDGFLKSDYRQKFKKEKSGRVVVTVTAAAPKHPAPVKFPLKDPAGGENLKDSLAMELDNPDVQAAARLAVGDEKDAYEAAKKISAWVSGHLQTDYGASSDRAGDVLRQMKGDCTEHSLLTVAMLRSVGIPAKRIDGLIYKYENGVPAYYWHEWVEAYVGQWTQLDPTFREVVADAAHLALGEETHEEIVQLIGQLKVVDVR